MIGRKRAGFVEYKIYVVQTILFCRIIVSIGEHIERKAQTMEKINKEELMKKLNLTEEELEKIAGGTTTNAFLICFTQCMLKHEYATADYCTLTCQKDL